MHWNPVIAGLTLIPWDELQNAHPFDLVIFDLVIRDQREYRESLIYRAEMVERKR